MKTTQDMLYVIWYFKPDLTSCQQLLTFCWAKTREALLREAAFVASVSLWLIGYGWWLAGAPLRKYRRHRGTAAIWTDASKTDGGGKCGGGEVRCEVLYDPGPGCALMDVVFIHGLRGDKLKTWKQGVWRQAGQKPEPVVVRSAAAPPRPAFSIDRRRLHRLAADEQLKEFTDCWPRDWLPLDCPYVRVITISYSTDPYLWRPIWLRKPVRYVRVRIDQRFPEQWSRRIPGSPRETRLGSALARHK